MLGFKMVRTNRMWAFVEQTSERKPKNSTKYIHYSPEFYKKEDLITWMKTNVPNYQRYII